MSFKQEKDRAKDLRKSRWWQNKIAQGTCYYCGIPVNKTTATMDHLVPLSEGGKSTKNNVVVACKACNNKKKDVLSVDFVAR